MNDEPPLIPLEQVGWVKPAPLPGRLIFRQLDQPSTDPDGWVPVYVLTEPAQPVTPTKLTVVRPSAPSGD
jgi:hypothetical protein